MDETCPPDLREAIAKMGLAAREAGFGFVAVFERNDPETQLVTSSMVHEVDPSKHPLTDYMRQLYNQVSALAEKKTSEMEGRGTH